MQHEELLYFLALKFVHGIGDINAKQLISYCGSATEVFSKKSGALEKIPGIGKSTIKSIRAENTLMKAEKVIEDCHRLDIRIIPYHGTDYPDKLKLVNDAPLALYYLGNGDLNNTKTISVVGTRNATDYGKEITQKIVQELARHEALIVSGLAYGIDITAHRAALKNQLSTVGVLAGGLDKIYPSAHKKIAEEMLEKGGLLSEQMPGVVPEAHFFPARNRIIAGMAEATIVVEAAKRGGALITANIAYSYDREVFAVPGDLVHKYSEGCNALIRSQKANIYTSADDLGYLLNWDQGTKRSQKLKPINPDNFTKDEKKILMMLKEFKDGLQLDELCWKSQLSINVTLSLLLNLEFAGHVKSLPGKKYKLI